MSADKWKKGYKEVRNIIHNEVGVTKEEVLDVFREIAREEIHKIVDNNRPFIYKTITQVIENEMAAAVRENRYPKVNGHIWYHSQSDKDNFKDFVAGVMKEEIIRNLEHRFSVDLDIKKVDVEED